MVRTVPPFSYSSALGRGVLVSSVVEPASVVDIPANLALTPPLTHAARTSTSVVSVIRRFIVVGITPIGVRMMRRAIVDFGLRDGPGWGAAGLVCTGGSGAFAIFASPALRCRPSPVSNTR